MRRRSRLSRTKGRYGLGLKTASISQCRRLTVVSRRAASRRRLTTRVLDIDHVEESDSWEVLDTATPVIRDFAAATLAKGPGTVIAWERLDRVLPERNPEGGWARRRLETLAERTTEYLGMVFHRYLADSADTDRLVLTVNGEKVDPWDPFAPTEAGTISLPSTILEIELEGIAGFVRFNPFVLPPRNRFSSQESFEHYSGPRNGIGSRVSTSIAPGALSRVAAGAASVRLMSTRSWRVHRWSSTRASTISFRPTSQRCGSTSPQRSGHSLSAR